MPQRLPRFYADRQRVEDERKLQKILIETVEVEPEPGMTLRHSADGHHNSRRRGVPVISRGVSGTSPGTDPLGSLLQKEARGKR